MMGKLLMELRDKMLKQKKIIPLAVVEGETEEVAYEEEGEEVNLMIIDIIG